MRREEIASYLGLRLETVCRGLAHLREHGFVVVAGRDVKIQNMGELRQLVAGSNRHLI